MTWIKRLIHLIKANSSLTIIITAAILIELISFGQQLYTRKLLGDELEKRAESELTLKANVTMNSLKMAENSLQGHIWDLKRNLADPDSLYDVVEWVLRSHPNIAGCCIGFIPDYYPQKGRLFEPFAYWKDGEVVKGQAAGPDHDYTKGLFYQFARDQKAPGWTDPYVGDITKRQIITFAMPIHDEQGRIVAAFGLDVATDWLGDALNKKHLYPTSYDLLLSENGKVIASPRDTISKWEDVERVVSMINDSTVAKQSSKSGDSKVIKFTSFDGDEAYVFVSEFGGSAKWKIAVVCYDDEVYGKLNHMWLLFSLLNLVAMVVLALIVYGFANNNRRLQRIRVEQERINSELQVAKNIQMEMLPEKFPPFPERNDLDIYGSLVPAKAVGGDLFDFFLRDEKLFFCIGDVSGKGVPAAMVMTVTRSLFRSASVRDNNPAHIMRTINETMCQGNESSMFVTLFVGVLDLPSGRLRYCNAGHDQPLLLGETLNEMQVESHLPVGIFDATKFTAQECMIAPKTTIFLYTDGLTEAKNMERKQFTLARVKEVLTQHIQETPQALLECMSQAVALFVEKAEQSDDLTMLAIRYQPKIEKYELDEKLTLKNDVKGVVELGTFVKSVTRRLGLEEGQGDKLRLAVEEAVVNVIDYAYPIGTEGDVTIEAKSDGEILKFIITDTGIAFDPTEAETLDPSLSIDERPIGGLGILLVREMMDTINYERVEGQNILTLIKTLKK